MNISADLLPSPLLIGAVLLCVPIMLWSLVRAPWSLLQQNLLVPVYVGGLLVLLGLWSLQIGPGGGPGLHFLGLSAMVLVFGPALTLAGTSFVLLSLTAIGIFDARSFGINGLVSVVLPIVLAARLHTLVYHRFPKHYFVYLMISAHFSSMIVIATVMLVSALLIGVFGLDPKPALWQNYLIFLPVAMLPEGFINGAIMTMLTAYRPHWVRSFDDRDYIDGK